MQINQRQQCVCLLVTAAFAFVWIVARAAVQAITIDEADTFLTYVAPPAPTHWSPSANNQLLNSLLMRLFTSIFGAWHLSVRAPALIGAAVYIASAYAVVRTLARDTVVEWPLFVCLVYNPFVMDYLVAGRGYSLALGFWMAAIALIVCGRGTTIHVCIQASICAALSFSANFSFAFVNMFVIAVVFLWASVRERGKYEEILAGCLLPGLTLGLLLTGSLLYTWPRGQFVYGATSLAETAHGIFKASLYEINPNLANPPLARVLKASGPWVFALLGVAIAAPMFSAPAKYLRWPAAFAGVAGATLGAHWLLYQWFGILLPKERTALYFAPLLFLVVGAVLVIPAPRQLRAPAIVLLYISAGYFLFCLRLTYFQEWKFGADVKEVYAVLSHYNRAFGVRDIFPNWRYAAALNFYRFRSDGDTIPSLEWKEPPYSGDYAAYVMYFPSDEDFIRQHRLKIVYYGRRSDVVVAIKPEVEARRAAAGSCSGAPPDPI